MPDDSEEPRTGTGNPDRLGNSPPPRIAVRTRKIDHRNKPLNHRHTILLAQCRCPIWKYGQVGIEYRKLDNERPSNGQSAEDLLHNGVTTR
ncbi:hypothetical protein AB0M22_38315 [Nocardia sp. NPDC051756]|uniref:hypothetical protein n=1 Tax=Nocardia sp. NPDC051756 TaxID=3154751 RepID=UPI003419FBE8